MIHAVAGGKRSHWCSSKWYVDVSSKIREKEVMGVVAADER